MAASWLMGLMRPISLIFALTLPFGSAVRADWRADVGYWQLQAELGVNLPTGAGIPILMSEALFGGGYYAQGTAGTTPYAGTGFLAGKTITPYSAPSGTSAHAAIVADFFCGSGRSVAPGVTDLHAWRADDYADMIYENDPPPVFAGSVHNHSWVGTFNSAAIDIEVMRRLDFMIKRDACIVTTPMNNGSGMQNLLANAYNGICMGLSNGNHPHTHSNLDGVGRMKPDLVVTLDVGDRYTSYASPAVASVATLLLDAVRPDFPDADDPRVVKAIMLSAATKEPFLGWQRLTSARPYDEIYGAGALNVLNAHHILATGRQAASEVQKRATRGWDRGTSSAVTPQHYFFTLPAGQWGSTFSATVTWHRQVAADFAAYSLANLNLRLAQASGFSVGSTVTESISSIDNVEHLFLRNLPPGEYVLEVSADISDETYGIAWEAQPGTGPQITLTRTGTQNVLSFSQLDPLETYTLEACTDLSGWLPATTFRTADTVPATTASWQENVNTGAKFYRLVWSL